MNELKKRRLGKSGTVIPGAKNAAQMSENLKAALLEPLTAIEIAHIDAITPALGGRKIWPA